MTTWSVITLRIDSEELVFDEKDTPTALYIDSGIDEQGWIDDNTYYALSFGRYQSLRFDAHLKNMHCPKFSGVSAAFVSEVENTGDTITTTVYGPLQKPHEERQDGYESIATHCGSNFPDEERVEFQKAMDGEYGFAPVIEPIESRKPPDAVLERID